MCSFCNFINNIFTVENFWSIVQTILGGFGIYFAWLIAQKQINISSTQKIYQERQMKLDVSKFKVEGSRDDLNRIMSQYEFIHNERYNKDSIYKNNIDEILRETDLMIGLAHKEVEKGLDIYNKLVDNNPMNYETTDVENIYSDGKTFKELLNTESVKHIT